MSFDNVTQAKRTCNLCDEMMTGGVEGFIEHGETSHPEYFLNGLPKPGSNKLGRIMFAKKAYWCPLNEQWYSCLKHLSRAVTEAGWTNEAYFNTHGEDHLPEEWARTHGDPKYGDSEATPECLECYAKTAFNEAKWHYPVFCSFSCSTTWHAKHTDRVEQAMATLAERIAENPDHNLRPTQQRYWELRGHSPEEAKGLVRERQQAGSLDRMIDKYGEEGARRYNEGLENRKTAIHQSDMFKGGSVISKTLFENVKMASGLDLQYGDDETYVYATSAKKKIWVDCLLKSTNRVIEFYGDFWHAHRDRFRADDVIFRTSGTTAQDIWDRDTKREQHLRDSGFDVLVIWEKEYRDNPDLIMGKCLGFLQAKR